MLFLAGLLAGSLGVPAALAITLGPRVARYSRALAVLACGIAGPVAVVACAVDYQLHRADPGDIAAIALAGTLIIAVLSIPVSLLVAFLVLWLRRRRATIVPVGQRRVGA